MDGSRLLAFVISKYWPWPSIRYILAMKNCRFVDKKYTFSRALRHCHKLRDRHFDDASDFVEDISAMLTAQDLHEMIRYKNIQILRNRLPRNI